MEHSPVIMPVQDVILAILVPNDQFNTRAGPRIPGSESKETLPHGNHAACFVCKKSKSHSKY